MGQLGEREAVAPARHIGVDGGSMELTGRTKRRGGKQPGDSGGGGVWAWTWTGGGGWLGMDVPWWLAGHGHGRAAAVG
jgi:hypothetical protein